MSSHFRRALRRLGIVSAAAALGALTTLSTPVAVAAAGPVVPALAWTDCGDGLQCAQAAVPLDYDKPNGKTITLAVIRRPATDPANRIGSLFVNNGGPGNSVVDFVAGDAQDVVPADVRARFDIVGFDPRGVGRSTPVRCFASAAEQERFFADRPAFPVTSAETAAFTAGSRELGRRCAERNGDLLAHLSTANVARDLDLLRQAVGDDQLTMAGYSYGGLLAITYANMFPGRVRALLLDGLPDPVQYHRGGFAGRLLPVTMRIDSAPATSAALGSFLSHCAAAGPQACAFATPDPAVPSVPAKFDALLARLRTGPVTVQTPDGPVRVTYAFLVDALRGGLQYPPIWGFVAEQLQATWQASDPAGVLRRAPAAAAPAQTALADDGYDNTRDAFFAVVCAETTNPTRPDRWSTYAALADARTAYFGADWAWLAQPCATWPARDTDRYTGAFTAPTANPLLFVNALFDAASNYRQAKATAAAVPGARLITVDGPGHPASFIPNACLSAKASAYLLRTELPPPGAICTPDAVPFSQ